MSLATDDSSDVYTPTDYSKIQVGIKRLEDAIVEVGDFKRANPSFGDKETVLQAIERLDYAKMREISNFYYRVSGIYSRLCRYLAVLYRYDWRVITYDVKKNASNNDKIVDNFNKALRFFDQSDLKNFFGDCALKVVRNGVYYGYIVDATTRVRVQELPVKYCRSRYLGADGRPAVEFNMQYFDDVYADATQRKRILNLFPKEFRQGYNLYKDGKLVPDYQGDTSGWYLLDPQLTIKFNLNKEDYPPFISVIPAIIDLDEAKALDRKKMQQQLLKIIIQKLPLDKNGELLFSVEEAQELHNNVVRMVGKAIGIDVVTSFADIEVADMAEKTNNTTADDLEKAERTVYNEAGVSQMQFNTNGNIALEKSILNDEAAMYNLITQFEAFMNLLIKQFNKNSKQYYFAAQILPTTIYNYKDLSKLYKEQTQLGYSKILPSLALGNSQSSILADAHFENNILHLSEVFIPPMSSNTMSSDTLKAKTGNSDSTGGRPKKDDDEKSTKTIQNIESQG